MNKKDYLLELKKKYENKLLDIEEEISKVTHECELICTEVDIFDSLKHKGKYYQDSFSSLSLLEDNLNETLIKLKDEKSCISYIIDFISNKMQG